MVRVGALEPITPGASNRRAARQSIGASSKTPAGRAGAKMLARTTSASADALEEEFEKVAVQLKHVDWERRVEALECLAAAATEEASSNEAFLPLLTRHLREPLKEQVADMRSAVLKVACASITQLASVLGDAFAPLAEHLIPLILVIFHRCIPVLQRTADHADFHVALRLQANTCKSIQVIVDDANACILSVLESTQSARLVNKIVDAVMTERNPMCRSRTVEYLSLILEQWEPVCVEKYLGAIAAAIKKSLADAASDARIAARRCYWFLKARWPAAAESLAESLDPTTLKQLKKQDSNGPGPLPPADHSKRALKSAGRVLRKPDTEEISKAAPPQAGGAVRVQAGTGNIGGAARVEQVESDVAAEEEKKLGSSPIRVQRASEAVKPVEETSQPEVDKGVEADFVVLLRRTADATCPSSGSASANATVHGHFEIFAANHGPTFDCCRVGSLRSLQRVARGRGAAACQDGWPALRGPSECLRGALQ